MSCNEPRKNPLPHWLDNLGDTYGEVGDMYNLPYFKHLSNVYQVVTTGAELYATDYTSYQSMGRTAGSLYGGIIGGALAGATSALYLNPYTIVGAITFAGFVYLGSRLGEEFYQYVGEGIGHGHDAMNPHTGSDPGADCPDDHGNNQGDNASQANRERGLSGAMSSNPQTPIVLDMDGDGLELIPLAASRVMFDMDNDGFKERTTANDNHPQNYEDCITLKHCA